MWGKITSTKKVSNFDIISSTACKLLFSHHRESSDVIRSHHVENILYESADWAEQLVLAKIWLGK